MLYVAAALAFVFLAARQIEQQGVREERARVAEARADSLYSYALHVEQTRKADSILHAHDRDRWVRERDDALALADRAAERRPEIVTRIIEVAGDSAAVVEAVEQLEVNHTREVSALRGALAAADSVTESQRLELADYAYANGQLRAALEASRAESRAWEATSQPKLLGLFPASPNVAFVGGVVATLGGVAYLVLR